MSPIDRAAEILGSQQKLADLLGVTKGAVNQWRLPGRNVPVDHCPAIERATGVACEDLREDLNWVRVEDSDWPHPQGRPLVDHCAKAAA